MKFHARLRDHPQRHVWGDLLHFGRGVLMGAADIIPGVSGGTVALVVGIYYRLIAAISAVNREFFSLVRAGRWSQAAAHLDLRFLIALGLGIATGAAALGSTMERLLTFPTSRAITLAVFLGMILASTYVVARLVRASGKRQKVACAAWALAAAGFAYWLTGLEQVSTATGLPYIFLCGMIGICAMILPGISGAYLLIILGFYPQLTDILHRLKEGDIHGADLVTIAVFGGGCVVGIISFSKVLRWLLSHHLSYTMSALAGFMLGALRKVWPFQRDLTPDQLLLKNKLFEPYWPAAWDSTVMWCLVAGIASMLIVLCIDRLSRADSTQI